MAEGNTTGGGGDAEDQLLNWFDIVTKKLMMEISSLIKCAMKVLFPPSRGHGNQRSQGKFLLPTSLMTYRQPIDACNLPPYVSLLHEQRFMDHRGEQT